MKDTLENELQQATAWAEDVRDRRERISRRADAFQREHDTLMDKRDELVSERESSLREFAKDPALPLPWTQIEKIDGQLRVIHRRAADIKDLVALIRDQLQETKGEISAAVSAVEQAERTLLKERVRARARELENTPAPKRYAALRTEFDITQPHLEKILGRAML